MSNSVSAVFEVVKLSCDRRRAKEVAKKTMISIRNRNEQCPEELRNRKEWTNKC